jgi:hypothetical protein
MTFESALKSHLGSHAALTALVSDRIYPLTIPEKVPLPAVVYQRIITTPENDIDGLDGKLLRIRVQVTVWSRTTDNARQIAEVIRLRMQTAALTFSSVMLFDSDTYDPTTGQPGVVMDFSCGYRTT